MPNYLAGSIIPLIFVPDNNTHTKSTKDGQSKFTNSKHYPRTARRTEVHGNDWQ